MTTAIPDQYSAELLSPDEKATASDRERLRAYSEDWVSAPTRAQSGSQLGSVAQRQVGDLFARGITEAEIQTAAFAELAREEARISKRHKIQSWIALIFCLTLGVCSVVFWQGRGEASAQLLNIVLLGAIGLMLAHGFHMSGVRRRTRLIRSTAQRKDIWRQAIGRLSGQG